MGQKKGRSNKLLQCCGHVMKTLVGKSSGPEMWLRKEFKEIRECVAVLRTNPDKYPPVFGNDLPDGSNVWGEELRGGRKNPSLTEGYVAAIAQFRDLSAFDYPILQVVEDPCMAFENTTHRSNNNSMQFTHLRVRDGSNNVMMSRLSMHLAHEGNKLNRGDIIWLTLFTPLTYRCSGRDKPHRSPSVVVQSYEIVGYSVVPDNLNSPLHCVDLSPKEMEESTVMDSAQSLAAAAGVGGDGEKERLFEVKCTPERRYCSVYGVNVVVCVCESDPVDGMDLETIRHFCWFATKDLSKMNNENKRNMLYWWYMTNTYNICGKGRREDPPACLKSAIRKAYPSEDGWYKKFVPGRGGGQKRKHA